MLNRPIHHLGYIVDELEPAVRQWADLGVGPFFVLEHVPFDELRGPGDEVRFDHSAGFAYLGNVGLELQQMHDVSPPELADALGCGRADHLNHIAYALEDPGSGSAWLERQGFAEKVYTRSGPVEDRMHFVPRLGHMIELHQDSVPFAAFWNAIRDASASWDGDASPRSAQELISTLDAS